MSNDTGGRVPSKRQKASSISLVNGKKSKKNIENVRLDDLVLQNIVAAEQHCVKTVALEKVCKRMAMILRFHYDTSKFKLMIQNLVRKENEKFFVELYLFRRCNIPLQKNRSDYCFAIPLLLLQAALQSLLDRIKRFTHLKIENKVCFFVGNIIASFLENDNERNFIHVDQLVLRDCKLINGPQNAGARLIRAVSPFLKKLKFELQMPLSDADTSQFWSAISSCTNLKVLSIAPFAEADQFHKDYILDCLKTLKITKFEYNDAELKCGRFDVPWLLEALSGNNNLRAIHVADVNGHINVWNSLVFPKVSSILSQVRCFEFHLHTVCSEEYLSDIGQILQSLHEDGRVCVHKTVQYWCTTSNSPQNAHQKIWLNMLISSRRSIELRLTVDPSCKESINNDLDALSTAFDSLGFKITRLNNGSEVQYQNAKLTFKIVRYL